MNTLYKRSTASSLLAIVCLLPMNLDKEYIEYIQNKKNSPKTNYHLEALKEMEKIKSGGTRPKLLLHACCIVCACWPLDFLADTFDITILYNNSNIYPEEEYNHRLNELKRYIKEKWNDSIEVIVNPYDYSDYMEELRPFKDSPEGWTRCFMCYEKRMDEGFRYADEHGFDYFTTVMTFSRQKDSQKLNEIGLSLQEKYKHTKYFTSDFKKDNAQAKSNEICDAYDIYKQNYCGCEYSLPKESND